MCDSKKTKANQSAVSSSITEKEAWSRRAKALAEWVEDHMINRADAFGYYCRNREDRVQPYTGKTGVNRGLLVNHFRGIKTIGLHSASTDDTSLWLGIDIDRHDGDPDEFSKRNAKYARRLYEQLRSMGFRPLLYDSNGVGGRHLLVLFTNPQPTVAVRRFGLWLVREWREAGFGKQPEVFPKQDSIKNGNCKYGSWLRLPGRHHKRTHYTKVWDGKSWRSGEDAIDIILETTGDSFDKVPLEATEFRKGEEYKSKKYKNWRRFPTNLHEWDIQATFESKDLWARHVQGGQYEVQCPWYDEHTTGDDRAYLRAAVPEQNFPPTFKCHHSHCAGRDLHDIFEFFGQKTIVKFCGEAKLKDEQLIEEASLAVSTRALLESDAHHIFVANGEFLRWDGRKYQRVPVDEAKSALSKLLGERL